jgi:NAD(P)-dependent dehydrogenase (short-subunit alcohol dehydrogenase family)
LKNSEEFGVNMVLSVVVTGSSRGLGFGMANSFLDRGCAVVISGSNQYSTENAYRKFIEKYHYEQIAAVPCDVRSSDQVQSLWDKTIQQFGKIDIWVNNAGLSGPVLPLKSQLISTVDNVVETNLLGVIYGSTIALKGMQSQGFGKIYNMEGMGSDGRMHSGMILYGTTKYAQKYFNDALADEVKQSSIIIGALRPGMVVTDLIIDQYRDKPEEWQKVKRIFNLIAERVDVVAPWLVDKMLDNEENGIRINFLSRWKMLWRMLSMPFTKRDIFDGCGL